MLRWAVTNHNGVAMDPVSIDLAIGLISSYIPKMTDKMFGKAKRSKDVMTVRVYAEKGPKSSSLGTAYVAVTAFSEYPVSYKLKVSMDSDRVNSLDNMREKIEHIEEMHHLPEDRVEQRFKFAKPLPNFFGSPLKEPVTIELLSEDGKHIQTIECTLEYED